MIKDLYFYLKEYKYIAGGIYIQTTLMLILLSAFLFFIAYLNIEDKFLKDTYDGKAIFQIIDNYVEEKEDLFFNNEDYLNITKNFYNNLNNNNNFNYLSIIDQPIFIKDNNIENIFYEGYDEGFEPNKIKLNTDSYVAIKSIQMNQNAFDFNKLNIELGRAFNTKDFEYNNDNLVPIILGQDYINKFKINDILEMNFLEKDLKGKVIGFLSSDSTTISVNSLNTSLNRYIILPHMNFSTPMNELDSTFQKRTYLQRISGFIVTKDIKSDIKNMKQEVEKISQKTGFKEYLFLGENKYMTEYKNIMLLLSENKSLIAIFLSMIFLLYIFITSLILYLQNKKRLSYFSTLYLIGLSKKQILFKQWIELIIIFNMSYVTYQFIMSKIFVLVDIKINLLLFIFLYLLSILITFITSYNLIDNNIKNSLNSEFGGV